jgi:hypothetical protein
MQNVISLYDSRDSKFYFGLDMYSDSSLLSFSISSSKKMGITHKLWKLIIFSREKFQVWLGHEPATYGNTACTKYQRFSPPSQIAILKKNSSLDRGIQAGYLSTRHMVN